MSLRGRAILPGAIERLSTSLSHRGPDGDGYWFNHNRSVALGHRRLSILDLSSAGSQPMLSADGRYVIVHNGEIYNFLEIARELEGLGLRLRSASDTEVILLAYAQWGTDMLHRFNGMWSFAIYNVSSGELLLSRDRFGVKPMYYYADKECFVFASEVQAIERLIPECVTPDTDFMSAIMQFDVSQYAGEKTYLNEVSALLPGFNLRLMGGAIAKKQWYHLDPVSVEGRFEEQVSTFRDLLRDACRIRLRSDVPVATCLSGGVDSGSIVSLLGRERASEAPRFATFTHRSFTAAFPGTTLDETADAKLVAHASGMEIDAHVVECPSPDELELALRDCDGPMPSLAFYPIWKLYRHIKESGITVTMDGQGSDEMLGGYYLGYPALRGGWQSRNIRWMRDLARTYGQLHPDASMWMRNDWNRWKSATGSEIDQAVKRPVKKVLSSLSLSWRSDTPLRTAPLPMWAGGTHCNERNELAVALWNQVFTNPLPFLLHQYDRCSMASGVECRMPFMDYRLVEYVFSLPLASRVGHGYTKRILREAMKGILPERVRTNRTKTGFNAPFKEWLRRSLRDWFLDRTASRSFTENSFFDGRRLKELLESSPEKFQERGDWAKVHIAWWLDHRQNRDSTVVPILES